MDNLYKDLYHSIEHDNIDEYRVVCNDLLLIGYVPMISRQDHLDLHYVGPNPKATWEYLEAVYEHMRNKMESWQTPEVETERRQAELHKQYEARTGQRN